MNFCLKVEYIEDGKGSDIKQRFCNKGFNIKNYFSRGKVEGRGGGENTHVPS